MYVYVYLGVSSFQIVKHNTIISGALVPFILWSLQYEFVLYNYKTDRFVFYYFISSWVLPPNKPSKF